MSKVNGTGYISIMLRAECFMHSHNFRAVKSEEMKLSLLTKCVKSIVSQVHNLQNLYNTSGVFLTADSQKYGSLGFRDGDWWNKSMINTVVETLFYDLQRYGLDYP